MREKKIKKLKCSFPCSILTGNLHYFLKHSALESFATFILLRKYLL